MGKLQDKKKDLLAGLLNDLARDLAVVNTLLEMFKDADLVIDLAIDQPTSVSQSDFIDYEYKEGVPSKKSIVIKDARGINVKSIAYRIAPKFPEDQPDDRA